jgi:microcompartment protein CcmK/EutM
MKTKVAEAMREKHRREATLSQRMGKGGANWLLLVKGRAAREEERENKVQRVLRRIDNQTRRVYKAEKTEDSKRQDNQVG